LDEGLNPDLMVTDLLMPDENGFVLIKKMRDDPRFKRKPVIVCTSRCDRETISMAAELGVINYIQKPFTKAEVQKVVLESLDSDPQSHTFDDYLEAQKRLGFDQETYIQIAEMLSREVSEAISFVRSVLAHNYLQPALIRMRVLRNSSQTIGDQNLASAIMSTELLLERGDIPSVIAALEMLGGENLRLLDSVDFIRQRQANRQSQVTSE
jgi:CheY-like chemotaxis protein